MIKKTKTKEISYRVVKETEALLLEVAVNGLLDDGWKVQGGISVTAKRSRGHDEYIYCQAMVR